MKKPAYWLWRMLGNYTGSVAVTDKTTLGLSATWACYNIIGNSIASVPWQVMKEEPDGSVRPAREHYLYDLLYEQPSPLYSSADFRHALQVNAENGNGYAIIHYNGNGRIVELELIDGQVEPYLDKNRELWYKVWFNQPGRGMDEYRESDIFHIKGLSFDGLKGVSKTTALRESFASPLAAQKYGNSFYSNGAHLKSILEMEDSLNPEDFKRLREQIDTEYSGVDNVGKTMLLEHGIKHKSVGLNPKDAAYIEARKFGIEEIARINGVPLPLIGHNDGANTQQNFEQLNINYITYTLYPKIVKWEQEAGRKLFSDADKRQGYFARMNLNSLMRADVKSRADYFVKSRQGGWLTQNEIRKLEGKNALPGGDELDKPLASNLKPKENGNQE